MFIILLGLAAFFVAGSAAYFSVLGIATLFAGSYYQVLVMASALEFGKLIATSFLYRYWKSAAWFLRLYLMIAVFVLMGITSIGVFGYLSAAYQVNSTKFNQSEQQINIFEQQKVSINNEIEQIQSRIDTLNKSRMSQEQRLPSMSSKSAAPIYEDIKRSSEEVQKLSERVQSLQQLKIEKDTQSITLKSEADQIKDIGTFKFIAQVFNKPLDYIVKCFILILVVVFDPLAVSLVLAFNLATKTTKVTKPFQEDTEKEIIVVEEKQDTPPHPRAKYRK